MPFPDLAAYSALIYSLPEHHSSIHSSTLALIPVGRTLAKLEGQVTFRNGVVVDVWELVDFEMQRIRNYSCQLPTAEAVGLSLPLSKMVLSSARHWLVGRVWSDTPASR